MVSALRDSAASLDGVDDFLRRRYSRVHVLRTTLCTSYSIVDAYHYLRADYNAPTPPVYPSTRLSSPNHPL